MSLRIRPGVPLLTALRSELQGAGLWLAYSQPRQCKRISCVCTCVCVCVCVCGYFLTLKRPPNHLTFALFLRFFHAFWLIVALALLWTIITGSCCWTQTPSLVLWLELINGSQKWQELCAAGSWVAVFAMLWLFPFLMRASLPKSVINSSYDPALNTNCIWRSLPLACSEHPEPALGMFCKPEQFRYGCAGTGTSHSTSGQLFHAMYETLVVSDSCHDTLGLLIVVSLVLLHFCLPFFFLAVMQTLKSCTVLTTG